MLTKNFYKYMRLSFSSDSELVETFTLPDGTTSTSYLASGNVPPFKIINKWSSTAENTGVSFGTGTTPATVSDYCLESILSNTKISASSPSKVSFSRGDTYDEYSATFGVTNKTAEAITISEVGLTAMPIGGNHNRYALVDRTVLDTPITIPAGQSKQITYTIRFNYGA